MYCINCKSKKIHELVEENKVFYRCDDCKTKSGRAVIFDGKIKTINTSRGIKHIVAAALIIRDNKILLTQRRTYPFGLEVPVGHLEHDETIEETLRREIYEEVGLRVTSATLMMQAEQPESHCRYGAAIEEWAVFLVDVEGYDFVANNEIESAVWLSLDNLPLSQLTPNMIFVLTELGYISPRKSTKSKAMIL